MDRMITNVNFIFLNSSSSPVHDGRKVLWKFNDLLDEATRLRLLPLFTRLWHCARLLLLVAEKFHEELKNDAKVYKYFE